MNCDTQYKYSNGGYVMTKEALLDQYREYLGDDMENVPGTVPSDFIEIAIESMEARDPVGFIAGFKRWADEQGWLPCAGSAGTRAASGVNS